VGIGSVAPVQQKPASLCPVAKSPGAAAAARDQNGVLPAIVWNAARDGLDCCPRSAGMPPAISVESRPRPGGIRTLSAQGAVPDAELRARLEALITETQKRKPPSRASLVREGLIDGIRPVRSLLVAIAKLPWQATGEHPAIEYLAKLQALYLKGSRKLPVEVGVVSENGKNSTLRRATAFT
jgi:hypothetical protein